MATGRSLLLGEADLETITTSCLPNKSLLRLFEWLVGLRSSKF